MERRPPLPLLPPPPANPSSLDSRAFIDRASRIPRLDLCYQPQLEFSSRASIVLSKKSSYGTVTRGGRGGIELNGPIIGRESNEAQRAGFSFVFFGRIFRRVVEIPRDTTTISTRESIGAFDGNRTGRGKKRRKGKKEEKWRSALKKATRRRLGR